MEKEYQKAIHHTSTLILNEQYARALSILNFIERQGLHNTQITIMQSYCIKFIKGINSAITFLQNLNSEGPLIQMTIAQYYKQLHQKQNCLQNLIKIEKPNQKESQKFNLVSSMARNVKISVQIDKKPPIYQLPYGDLDFEAVNMINQIVYKYKQKQICPQQTLQEFQKLIIDRGIQGRLKQYVKKFIRYLEYQIKQKQ